MQKGIITFFEGFDYTGKTTLIQCLKDKMSHEENLEVGMNDCHFLKFPSNRKIIFRQYANELDEAMAFYHDQLNTLTSLLTKDPRRIVICDRGPISNYAYQWSKMEKGDDYFKYYDVMKQRLADLGYEMKFYVLTPPDDELLKRFKSSKKNDDKIDALDDVGFVYELDQFNNAVKRFAKHESAIYFQKEWL